MSKSTTDTNQSILELTPEEARDYFLKSESYCDFNLPEYFDFAPLLSKLHEKLNGESLFAVRSTSPRDYDDVNYKILDNKDGRYAWRLRQLIHPALYVSLVHQITAKKNWETICKRFESFAEYTEIECVSIPSASLTEDSDKAEQVSNWWQHFEQSSLELALDYKYLTHTDITNCYGSIYTHSVAWAIHDKDVIKRGNNRRKSSFIGNVIDWHLQDMSHGQTNGIPQDSALMHLIAEMVLGYVDSLLLEKIREESDIYDYQILRYRDDYRIFTNNPRDGEYILKCLTEVMIGFGLKISTEKTKSSDDIITSSIKDDKLYWMGQKKFQFNLQKRLLIIHGLAKKYPNSGSLISALHKFYLSLCCIKDGDKDCDEDCNRGCLKNFKESVIPLISIVVDIAHDNPRIYPIFATIISFLLEQIQDKDQKKDILEQIIDKFDDIPNTGHLFVWLQRIALGIEVEMDFDEKLCQLISNRNNDLWNNSWLPDSIKNEMKADFIINRDVIAKLSAVISREEIALFKDNYKGSY